MGWLSGRYAGKATPETLQHSAANSFPSSVWYPFVEGAATKVTKRFNGRMMVGFNVRFSEWQIHGAAGG